MAKPKPKKRKRHWTNDLRRLGACKSAIAWARGYRSLRAAWAACERSDWMLWLAGRMSGEPMSDGRRALTLAACRCARLALPHVPAGEQRPIAAIELAEQWARGDGAVTPKDLRAAAAATAATAEYVAVAAVASTAVAAAIAAAIAVAVAAATDADAAARCADIVRRHYPKPPNIRRKP